MEESGERGCLKLKLVGDYAGGRSVGSTGGTRYVTGRCEVPECVKKRLEGYGDFRHL